MSQDQRAGTPTYTGPQPGEPNSGWVTGGLAFAAVLMLCVGVLGVLQGIAAIIEDDVYGRVGNYVYRINLTGWGWIHLIIGACLVITAGGLFKAATWARVIGICLASLSLIAEFMFLPYSPIWSVVMIAVDVFIIWALAVYRSDAPRKA